MASGATQPAAAANNLVLTPVLTLTGHKSAIPSMSYFPNGKRMISGSFDKTTRQWDLEAGKEIEEAQDICDHVHVVEVSKDGRWVATGGGDYMKVKLKVCDIETGNVRISEDHSRCIDISADCTLLASGAEDSTVQIWSLETGELVAGPFKSDDTAGAVRFSQDSKKLAVKSWRGKHLEVWNIKTQKLNGRVGKFGGVGITSAPVFWTTNDKTIIAAFSFTGDCPKAIYEFEPTTLMTVGTPFQGHTCVINSLTLSLDCALLASASDDHTIRLWAFESRQLLASFDVPCPLNIILTPDSRQIAYTTLLDHNIYLCNTPPGILASIRLARQSPRVPTSAPKPISLVELPNPHTTARVAAVRREPTMDWARAQTPGTPSHNVARLTSVAGGWIHKGPTPDLHRSPTLPVIPQVLPPSPQLPPLHHQELLSLFSDTSTDPPILDHRSGNFPHEAILPNLTGCVTKDDDYPAARGGFGEIWKCTYYNNRRPIKVAVKALQVYTTDQTGEAKKKKNKRIKRELRICAKLKHANVLPVYGYTDGFGPFVAIVSPWAENGNLTTYLEREGAALTLVKRFQMLIDIIAGLQYLHINNVIHGDFNGPNVLINGDGTACIADFGLSLMYSEVVSASQASWTSNLKGNVRWMAPELLVLEREDGSSARPSEQSDIYSFGGIMLQVLTNKIPYYYLPNDAAIILAMHKSEKPSRSRYPVLPEIHWQFIEECWSTDPRDRPSTERADGVIRNEFYSLLSRTP